MQASLLSWLMEEEEEGTRGEEDVGGGEGYKRRLTGQGSEGTEAGRTDRGLSVFILFSRSTTFH